MPFNDVFQLLALYHQCHKKMGQDLSDYMFFKSDYNHCINHTFQMFIKNPKQILFTFSNHEESFTYLCNILYIICTACLSYFQKENIILN